MENRYAIQSFGIASEQIPISYTGKIKLGYIRQWMGVRRIIESTEHIAHTLPLDEILLEFPKEHDVVFRQGSSCTNHSANMGFRNYIISKVREQELSKASPGMNIRRKNMVLDIVNEVRGIGKGRFLIWNDNGGWNELLDDEIIHSKIEYLIKEFRKTVRNQLKAKPKPQIVLSSSTSMFYDRQPRMVDQNLSLPLDPNRQVDENELLEAASCVANCFNMKAAPAQTMPPQQLKPPGGPSSW